MSSKRSKTRRKNNKSFKKKTLYGGTQTNIYIDGIFYLTITKNTKIDDIENDIILNKGKYILGVYSRFDPRQDMSKDGKKIIKLNDAFIDAEISKDDNSILILTDTSLLVDSLIDHYNDNVVKQRFKSATSNSKINPQKIPTTNIDDDFPDYVEKQIFPDCGVHAINNLFQCRIYKIDELSDISKYSTIDKLKNKLLSEYQCIDVVDNTLLGLRRCFGMITELRGTFSVITKYYRSNNLQYTYIGSNGEIKQFNDHDDAYRDIPVYTNAFFILRDYSKPNRNFYVADLRMFKSMFDLRPTQDLQKIKDHIRPRVGYVQDPEYTELVRNMRDNDSIPNDLDTINDIDEFENAVNDKFDKTHPDPPDPPVFRKRVETRPPPQNVLDKVKTELIAATEAEKDRLAKIEKANIEKAKIEADRLAAEQAEKDRVAKIEADRLAAEKAEEARLAKIESDRIAAEQAEKDRIAAEQAEKDRLAKIEEARLAKIESDRLAAEKGKAEAELALAQTRAENDKLAKEIADIQQKMEADRAAEVARVAKIEAAKIEADKIEADRIEQEKANLETLTKNLETLTKKLETEQATRIITQTEKEKMEIEIKAINDELEKTKADQIKAENNRLAVQAEKDRLAEQAEKDRLANDKTAAELNERLSVTYTELEKTKADQSKAEKDLLEAQKTMLIVESRETKTEEEKKELEIKLETINNELAKIKAETDEALNKAIEQYERETAKVATTEQANVMLAAEITNIRNQLEKMKTEHENATQLAKIESDRMERERDTKNKLAYEQKQADIARLEEELKKQLEEEQTKVSKTEEEKDKLAAEINSLQENLRDIKRQNSEAEEERLAKIEIDRLAAEKAEDARLAKIEADRLAAEKAEEARLAKIESDRIAAEQAEKDRLAKIESDRLAAEKGKAEAELALAAEKAEKDRLAKEITDIQQKMLKIEADRLAAEQAEKDRLEAVQLAEVARLAEQARLEAERKKEQEEKDQLEIKIAQLTAELANFGLANTVVGLPSAPAPMVNTGVGLANTPAPMPTAAPESDDALRKQLEIMNKKLEQSKLLLSNANIHYIEYFPLDEITDKLDDLYKKYRDPTITEKEKVNIDNEIDVLSKSMLLNAEHIEMEKKRMEDWKNAVDPTFERWHNEMKMIIPKNVKDASIKDLQNAGFPTSLANRIFNSRKCYKLIHMTPEEVNKMMNSDLVHCINTYDIREQVAIMKSFPKIFTEGGVDNKKKNNDFKSSLLESSVEQMYNKYINNTLPPNKRINPAYLVLDPNDPTKKVDFLTIANTIKKDGDGNIAILDIKSSSNAPDPNAPDQNVQGQTAPGQTAPGQTAPDQTAPGQTAPGQNVQAIKNIIGPLIGNTLKAQKPLGTAAQSIPSSNTVTAQPSGLLAAIGNGKQLKSSASVQSISSSNPVTVPGNNPPRANNLFSNVNPFANVQLKKTGKP